MYSIPVIMMIVTLVILIAGVTLMALGNKLNIAYSTKLMCFRIVSQALVVVAIAILYFLQKSF
ncbi:MAG UNVERIFIED_CONTAM: hypothetical protein LVQ98_01375 [Rickettsiaceae bacterium]